jgi:hypothetical protein
MNLVFRIVYPVIGVIAILGLFYFIAPKTTVSVLQGIKKLGGFGDAVVKEVTR